MKNTRNGSMILACMFFISIWMLIILLHWRAQESMGVTTIMRAHAIQKQYAVESLMEYAIGLCKKQYLMLSTMIQKRKDPITIRFARWPLGNERYAQGIIEISYTNDFLIKVRLTQEGKFIAELSCHLDKKRERGQEFFTVFDWRRN